LSYNYELRSGLPQRTKSCLGDCRNQNAHADEKELTLTNKCAVIMPKITYIEHNGRSHTVDLRNGQSVMEGAVKHNIHGIDADCGGACACATCHVYVDEAWVSKTGEASAMEESMLDFAQDQRPNSRLACQIIAKDAIDGLIVRLPESQS
jgi:2Fe-2S ferredoxin